VILITKGKLIKVNQLKLRAFHLEKIVNIWNAVQSEAKALMRYSKIYKKDYYIFLNNTLKKNQKKPVAIYFDLFFMEIF